MGWEFRGAGYEFSVGIRKQVRFVSRRLQFVEERSRRSLLQRRALEKVTSGRNQLYKVSLSLVLVLWGLVFLFSLWISQGHGYGDGSGEPPLRISNWDGAKLGHDKPSEYADALITSQTSPDCPPKTLDTCVEKSGYKKSDLIGEEESKYGVICEKTSNSATSIRVEKDSERSTSNAGSENDAQKTDSFSHSVPLGLDEFKSIAFSPKIRSGTGPAGGVIHRVDPGGAAYNYASASKGAKILASNKEAKGAANILSRDKDKYLRNPCSAESKFVVIELSEETLVDTIEIANFEHHSSNAREFELFGSLVYPTDVWVNLGNFTAGNAKHAQRFVLNEPKWVRYVKLNLQTHYGSEFYCTLSVVEVYGVDAIERMLEDLIYTQDASSVYAEGTNRKKKKPFEPKPAEGDVSVENVFDSVDPHLAMESSCLNHEIVSTNVPHPVEEVRHQVGRMPGDTVLKILMQKVRSMDLNLSVLERYLEELNSKYSNILKQHNKEIEEKDVLLQKIKEDIRSLLTSQEAMEKEVDDLSSWKSLISMQLESLRKDNAMLRSEVNQVREQQIFMENKGMVIFLVCIIFASLAAWRLFLHAFMRACEVSSDSITNGAWKFCNNSSSWLFLLVSCSSVIFVLSL